MYVFMYLELFCEQGTNTHLVFLYRLIFVGIDLLFHGTEVHWMRDNT